jgi:hypothetical protein
MAHESVTPAGGPHELLAAVRDLTRQVRIAQRGTWFPLLIFAAITLAAIPVYRYGPRLGPCQSGPEGTTVCHWVASAQVYWPIALLLAYTAIAGFYVRQSRRRGVGTPIRPYVIVGVVVAVLVWAASLWLAFHPLTPFPATAPIQISPLMRVINGLANPTTEIGLALLVLAWVERSWALLGFSLVYLVIVLAMSVQIMHASTRWFFLPHLLIPAAVLLVGGIGFALFRPHAERRS